MRKARKLIAAVTASIMMLSGFGVLAAELADADTSAVEPMEEQQSAAEPDVPLLSEEIIPPSPDDEAPAEQQPADTAVTGAEPLEELEGQKAEAAEPLEDETEITPEQRLLDFKDPQHIADDTFFGKYENGAWTKPGYFDYDRVPGMAMVQEAAMRGDYAAAKEALLAYYREVNQSYQPGAIGGTSKNDRLTVELMEHNLHWNENSNMTLLGIFNFGERYQYYDIDLIDDISKLLSATDRMLTVYLVALRKDGSYVAFDSINKEGGNPPTLEITIGSSTRTIVATDDAYISPAENRNNNYGDRDQVLVEESVSSINKTLPVDQNTKRGMLKFDLSSIAAGATVVSARLRLCGNNAGGEGIKQIVAFKIANNSWTEQGVKYYNTGSSNFEHAVFSWDGEESFRFVSSASILKDNGTNFCSSRFPEELLRFSTWLKHSVGMYTQASSNNEHYAAVGLMQWAGFIKQRGSTPGFDKGLDVSVRCVDLPRFMKHLINSEYMTPELWSATVKLMWGMNNSMNSNAHQNNNWRTYEVRGMNCVNCYFYEFRDHYKWVERLRYYSKTNIDEMIRPDGTNKEGALGYAVYSLDDMLNFDQANRETGLTEEEHLPFSGDSSEKIRASLLYVMYMTAPGYVDNQVGDGGSYKTSYKGRFKSAGEKFDDPYLLYAGTDGKQGKPTPITSTRYLEGPRYAMRTGWNKNNDLYLYTETAGGYGSHGHAADNNIILFGYGNYLLTDQLFYTYTYSSSIYKELTSTRMHNTVEIDETNQTIPASLAGRGKENRWETNNSYDVASLTPTTYSGTGVTHTRNTIFLKPNFWIVTDYMKPNNNTASHKYWQHWHMLPNAGITLDPVSKNGRSNFESSANIQIAQAGADETTASIELGKYSEGTGSLSDANYLRYAKSGTGPQTFQTILYPERPGQTAQIEAQAIPLDVENNGASAMEFTITEDQNVTHGWYYLVNDSAQIAERSCGTLTVNGGMHYVERDKNGNYTRYLMQDGTEMSQDGTVLVKSLNKVEELAIDISSTRADINTSKDIDLSKLTFYAGRPLSNVYLNGSLVEKFQMSGAYVYFGEPIVTPPSPAPTANPSVPSGGGGSGGAGHGSGGVGSGKVIAALTTPSPGATTEPTASPEPGNSAQPSQAALPETVREELSGHWGAEEIGAMYQKGMIQGKDGSLALGQTVTRAEFAAMLLRAMDIQPAAYEGGFADVAEGSWYAGYLQAAYDAGLLSGSSDGTMMPDAEVSREQMAKMLVAAYESITGETVQPSAERFSDDADISGWAVDYVYKAKAIGLLQGDEINGVAPKRGTKRDESAVVIYRLLERGGSL